MNNFKFDTTIQFPFFKLNEVVTYSQVKKPSGVAYILLVLINESKSKTDRLAKVLENFGVPKLLHYIFADTICYLFDQDILERVCDFNKNEFDTYKISDFKFTARGKKIFAEESIPTGVNKDVKVSVFYDIAKNELSLKLDSDLEPRPLMDCAITPKFVSKFKCKKDVEAFLNLQKGKGISVRKEEIITKVEEYEYPENWVGKYGCTVNVDGEKVDIKFDDLILQNFFEANYTNDMITQSIAYKSKFKFKSSYNVNLKLSKYSDFIDGILIPRELDDVLKRKSKMVITKGNYVSSSSCQIISEDCINSFDNKVEFIQVDMHDSVFAYIPGMFNFVSAKFGEIKIPLVLKLKLKQESLRQIVKPYVDSIMSYSEDNFKQLVQLTNITKDSATADGIIKGYLGKDPENNIVCLNEMKQYALSNASILNTYKSLLEENYNEYISGVTEDNLESCLKITGSITKFLNIPNKDVLNRIFKNLKVNNSVRVYEILVNMGFDKSIVVLYVNPIPDLINGKSAEEKSLLNFANFDRFINSLKKITGVTDYKKYVIDDESINHQEFKNAFNGQFNLQKSVEFLRNSNDDLFKEYDGFLKVFNTINDNINTLDAALKNPNNIKADLIDKKISAGDYQFVFVNLSAKLEIILKNKYGLDGKLSDMLSEARMTGLIERSIVSDLHEFRESRNAYIHPEGRNTNFKADDLRRWNKEIFNLEEDEK